ncbi:hypothetical protein A6V29_03120 [Blastococcus sp. CCUG 61487]|nr:hypothetical protein A6V29_03120 [Blastococcus sp. CCUG 61487]
MPGPRLWWVDLRADDGVVAYAEGLLTDGERSRARRGVPAVHRRRVLLRAALRSLLAAELGVPAQEAPVTTTPAGRPELPGTSLDVSCSADGALGLVALATGLRVGVDVETIAPWDPAVLDEGWLHPDERAELTALPVEARPTALTRCWTQKEAVLKGLGTGLGGGPARLRTPVGPGGGEVSRWTVRAVPAPSDRVASVATSSLDGRHRPGWQTGAVRPSTFRWREATA